MTEIFVFGSNLRGAHGRGAALAAKLHHGAIPGQGVGPQGRSYAIPTKDWRISTLPLAKIAEHVHDFIEYAAKTPGDAFRLTPIGCGLAGYTPEQIAPMFRGAPSNVVLPEEFKKVLERNPT